MAGWGTLLLVERHLTAEDLASAFAEWDAPGFGEFGSYLVRTGILTREQLAEALAHQAALSAEVYRKYRRRWWCVLNGSPPAVVPKLGEVLVQQGLLTSAELTRC